MSHNREYNVRNPHQGKSKKVLCVCSAGLLRSPTLANVLHREFGYNTRAVGVVSDYALIPLDRVQLLWADEVVFVEPRVHKEAKNLCTNENWGELEDLVAQVTVLGVPDKYEFMSTELQKICLKQYNDALMLRGE